MASPALSVVIYENLKMPAVFGRGKELDEICLFTQINVVLFVRSLDQLQEVTPILFSVVLAQVDLHPFVCLIHVVFLFCIHISCTL